MNMADEKKTPLGSYDDRTVVAARVQRKKSTPDLRNRRMAGASDGGNTDSSPRTIDVSPYIALNPLTEAASVLLNLYVYLKREAENPGTRELRDMVSNEIHNFEEALDQRGYDRPTILAARYCLCTVIDEAVMRSDQEKEQEWAKHSLLSLFHNETWGGEKFFHVLNRLLLEPRRYIDLLEFLYLCLRLGFGGHYKAHANGPAKLDILIENLYLTIRRERGVAEGDLSPDWQNGEIPPATPISRIPLRWVFLVCLVGLGIVFMIYSASLQGKIETIEEGARASIPVISPTTAE